MKHGTRLESDGMPNGIGARYLSLPPIMGMLQQANGNPRYVGSNPTPYSAERSATGSQVARQQAKNVIPDLLESVQQLKILS